jgi:Leucine-rich repeat (LRR) protein
LRNSGLKELLLGNNCITTLGNLANLPSGLNILDVRDNKIDALDDSVACLTQLQRYQHGAVCFALCLFFSSDEG